ncbi:MAG: dTMP kinase, partial [Dehalococcoidia bacterium]
MSSNQSNRFIVLEGIDASGKSTQCRMLSDRLNKKNIPFVSLREPGDTKIAELIRGWLSQKSDI